MTALAERLLSLCIPEPNTGCWLWMGDAFKSGHGRYHHRPGTQKAHRLMYHAYPVATHRG